jgi:hypothetical protein
MSRAQPQARDLVKLRRTAMRLANHLQTMMPPVKTRKRKGAPVAEAELAATEPPKTKELPPEFEQLLGRNKGVIESFGTLVGLVIRLVEKEREAGTAGDDDLDFTEEDEDELDRRIHAELDRIAERRRAAGGIGPSA